jgi:hypothetical protein
MSNIVGKLFDGDAVLDTAHILLRQVDLVERDVLRLVESDLVNGLCHIVSPWPAGRSLSPTAKPATKIPSPLLLPFRAAAAGIGAWSFGQRGRHILIPILDVDAAGFLERIEHPGMIHQHIDQGFPVVRLRPSGTASST